MKLNVEDLKDIAFFDGKNHPMDQKNKISMKLTLSVFDKVKKDCLKFIKSQETKADKFKNKERMIKSFLIPLCFWISKKG